MRISIGIIAWLVVIFEGLLSASIAAESAAANPAPSPDAVRFFETKVRPVLADNCFQCHGADKQEDNLRLDSRAGIDRRRRSRAGRRARQARKELADQGGAAFAPICRCRRKKQLPSEQIADLTLWIKSGAVWPG